MLEESLTYALERKQFGQPIAEFQLVQAMLAACGSPWPENEQRETDGFPP